MAFSMFGTPQQPQQQQSIFQTQSQPFQQQSTSLFPQQQLQQPSMFPQFQQPQLQQQQQQQQQQQLLYLFTNEKSSANYSTKWADLHPDSQKLLLQIEERILEHRDESQRLDQCSRLYDSSMLNEGFEIDASHIVQELGGVSTAMERQKALIKELMTNVKEMLRNAETVIHSFVRLRPRFVPNSTGSGTANAPPQPFGATAPVSTSQPASSSIMPSYDFYIGFPKKPSPFLQQTVSRFEKYLGECRQWIEEVEQLLLLDSDKNPNSRYSLLQSLPNVMINVHDFFVHVAAKVESIHQHIDSMKTAYLADQRRRGDANDPFLEADRRETAKLEAAAKRVHPTLHLPANSQPSTQVSGLANIATRGTSAASQTLGVAPAASSGSGFSLFNTPASSSSMPSSLFATPTTSAPASSLFRSSGAAPQPSLFGSSSASPFGATSTPSLFSNTAPSFGSGGSLFSTPSTPFATGAVTGSGASFGVAAKSSRPKSRTPRR